ncbi:MAG: FecR domain-containing protein [Pseudomonadota bacterium]
MHPRADIRRYLDEGLASEEQARVRQHLRSCAECRDFYDAEQRLLRALAGDSEQATRVEDRRMLKQALRSIGVERVPERRPAAERWISWLAQPRRLAGATLAVALAVAVGILVLQGPGHAPAPTPAVKAATIVRAVKARVQGAPVTADAVILSGQVLTVAREGVAEVTLERGGTLRVYPDSALVLSARGERVELQRGKVWAEVEAQRGPFQIRTRHGIADVLGTSFVVENRANVTEVRVMRGEVAVRGVGHNTGVKVRANQLTRVAAGSAPEPAQGYRPEADISDWEHFVRDLLHMIEKGLREGLRAVEKALQPEKK